MKEEPKEPAAPPWRETFLALTADLPETVEIPYEMTPEGERLADFKKVCPEQFIERIDRNKLGSPKAFDRVAAWDGRFPGPCAVGRTGTGKTRAAWSALGRLYVKENRPFSWFPVRRLVSELEWYDEHSSMDAFFRWYSNFRIIMIDDIDKINWQFESQGSMLFAFYDWIYRRKWACLTTTNQPRTWWADKMGEAFARRLFDDAHTTIHF